MASYLKYVNARMDFMNNLNSKDVYDFVEKSKLFEEDFKNKL